MFLVYDPVDGDHQTFNTLKEAQVDAKELIEIFRDADGWPHELEDDGVKIYKLVEQSVKCDVKKSDNSDWDYVCNYKMKSVGKTDE